MNNVGYAIPPTTFLQGYALRVCRVSLTSFSSAPIDVGTNNAARIKIKAPTDII